MSNTANLNRTPPLHAPCLLALIMLSLAGCGTLLGKPDGSGARGGADKISNTGDLQLDKLNQGYSLLYGDVSGLRLADKILLIKFETDRTEAIVTHISDYASELTAELAQLPKRYPSLRIDLQPLPEIERRKQAAAQKERVLSFAPIVGRTGPDFERTLLLTLSGGLNQLRFMTQVMAEQERNADRSRILKGAEQRFLQLYRETLQLLNEDYYKVNSFDPKGKRG